MVIARPAHEVCLIQALTRSVRRDHALMDFPQPRQEEIAEYRDAL